MPDRCALIVVNRRGRRGRMRLDDAVGVLERARYRVAVHLCRQPRRVPEVIARDGAGADVIIVGGGDGTISTALAAVLAVGRPLGILPMGTANDLARTLGLPADLQAAAAVIAAGRTRAIDVGVVNGRPFVNVASMGVSVEVARRLTPRRKRRWGLLAYIGAAWEALQRQQSFEAVIEDGGGSHRLRCMQIAIGNGRYYGGGMTIVDDAAIDDGRLDLYALPRVGGWRLLVLLPVLRWGRHRPVPEILSLHGAHFRITTDPPVAINVDGEVVACTPAEFTLRPRALRVYAPAPGAVAASGPAPTAPPAGAG